MTKRCRSVPKTRNLFHLIQSLGLVEVVASDRNRREQYQSLFRFLSIAEKPYQSLERSAHLAAGQLLDSGRKIAEADLPKRLGQSVEADQLHFAEHVAALQCF